MATTSNNNSLIGTDKTNIKLPNIVIPQFSGDYLQWKAFRDLFIELIHNNTSIGKTQKLFYLKSNLSGEPHELIKHLQITAANYDTAWEILDKRFNNKRTLIDTQLKALLNQSVIVKESAKAIKKLHDTSNECLLAIKNLEIKTDDWDPILIHILTQKLDKESHRLYEQSLTSPRETQTLKHFFEFLENRFQSLELLEGKNKTNVDNKYNEKHIKTYHGAINVSCPICQQPHKIYGCDKFSKMTFQQKLDAIKANKLCENCLVAGHFASKCKSWSKCKICHKKHHTLIHKNRYEQAKQTYTKPEPSKTNQQNMQKIGELTAHFANSVNQQVLLPTALVMAQRKDGTFIELRALMDQGSQATFVTEEAVQRLQLTKSKTHAIISGVGATKGGIAKSSVELTLKPRFESKFILHTTALVMSKLTGLLPSVKLVPVDWIQNKNLILADPTYYYPKRIDIIIGADIYSQTLKNGVIKESLGTPVAQETEFGYVLSGKIQGDTPRNTVQCYISEIDISNELTKFWESEELMPEKIETAEELECEMHYKVNYRRGADGRYIVRLPLRASPSTDLVLSRELALARLFQMERRFKTNKILETMYKDFMKEYIQLGHMVPATDDAEVKYYLPHHAVFKHDSTTTKLRVVFDASAKRTSMKSLNELMMVGSEHPTKFISYFDEVAKVQDCVYSRY